ncbi:unnamed protein product [Caretta caretta]
MIFSLNETIQQLRNNGFEDLWKEASAKTEQLDLEEPCLPCIRKATKRIDRGSRAHVFATLMDMHGKLFYEVFDHVTRSLDLRFVSDVQNHLTQMEQFTTGSEMIKVEQVTDFYADDLDKQRLKLHHGMFLDITPKKNRTVSSVEDVVSFLKTEGNEHLHTMLPEYCKFIRILLTEPVSSCTAERSFSSLRRVKNYLRTSIGQMRLK